LKKVEISEVVDSARYLGLPLRITLLTICIMLVDGYDLQTMSFVAPELVTDWGISRSVLAPVLSASLIGMAIGSVLLGRLGDRIGRKNAYVTSIVFLFIGSVLSANAVGLWDLFAWRLLTGIGLGGVTPLATTLISEWTPKHSRSVAVACAIVAVPLGGMAGAQIAHFIIPAYGWRMIFYVGAGLPLVVLLVAWGLLPESPRFLAQHPKRHAELARALNRLLGEQRFDGTEAFHIDEPPAPPGNWLLLILRPPYRRTTLLLWAAFACNTLALYACVNWLPTIITSIGLSREIGLQSSTWFNFGGFFGAVGGAVLIGYLGSRLVSAALGIGGAIVTVLIGLSFADAAVAPGAVFFLLIVLAGTALNGMQSFLYTVGANSYPTYVRAAGIGCAQTVSRIGGVLSSALGGAYFALQPVPSPSYFFYVLAAVILVVVATFSSMRTHISSRKAVLAATV
jgi:AAHS family 4-hydroxybenzoate transporter-like MFS transporter